MSGECVCWNLIEGVGGFVYAVGENTVVVYSILFLSVLLPLNWSFQDCFFFGFSSVAARK